MRLTRRQAWLFKRMRENGIVWGGVGFVIGCAVGAVTAGAAVSGFALYAGLTTVACAALGAVVALFNPTYY
jgi:hypothetical protein